MEWSKLKNIIILLLVLVNLLLLLLTGGRERLHQQVQDELHVATLAFLEKNGLSVEPQAVPWGDLPDLRMTERDTKAEQAFAKAVLGESYAQSLGTATEYSADTGSLRLYSDGRFAIYLKEGLVLAEQENQRHAQKYMEKIGFSLQAIPGQEEDAATQRFVQLSEGLPVFNCEIELQYQNGSLRQVQGRRLVSETWPDATQGDALDAPTLLLRLLDELHAAQIPATKLGSIQSGYVYESANLSVQSSLVPVWRLETDVGRLLLNCVTGKIEQNSIWAFA